ncbi:FAD:protein FMN transferase [Crenobacter caeni]|uniref:FAD:protein FMN transferase n=1 Tax=Crenobacter caeni TaxID=2705474 RepID=A0A6B2KN48_9NEIS|nr:FAD:protein FMN transferase [Crenobacter caeni]NDV11429.1 FAD:protein FMN transferase [Crenobacter caeni]
MRALALAALLLLSACGAREPYRQEAYAFGTRIEVTVDGAAEADARRAVGAVLADLDALHKRLHAWQPGSEIVAINDAFARGEPAPVSADLADLIARSRAIEAASDGLFSPAIGRLVRLWGFHADNYAPVTPGAAELAALVGAKPRLSDVSVQGGRIASSKPEVALDLGGVAKGWALERAYARLKAAGVRSALVNIGGNVIALGQKADGSPWTVGIRHPRRNEAMASVELADGEAIGTSGDYQRYFEAGGTRHCHLVDPRDGNTGCALQAATVLASGAGAGLKSDAVSKPLYFAGPKQAAAYARRMGVRDILLVDGAGEAWLSPSFARRIHWLVKPAVVHTLEQP